MKSWVTSFTQKGKCLKVSMIYCLSSTLVDLNYTNIFPPHFTYSFNICRAAHSFLWLIQFSFLCFYSSAFSSTYVFIFMIQALKNIAAISLAISYPNKSTQLLNMSPWERHTQEEGTAYSSRGVGWGSHTSWLSWLILTMQVSGNPPRTPSAFTSHQSYCAAMDGELKKHFPLSLCPFCLIGESSVWCNGIHLNRNTSEVLFFFEFGFYLKRLGWRTWSVPNSQLSRGSVFPFPAFSSSKIAASPQLTVVKTGHLGNWCVLEDMLENHKLTVRPCGISLLTTWRKYWATGSFYTSHVYFSETFASFTYLSSLHCSLEKSVSAQSHRGADEFQRLSFQSEENMWWHILVYQHIVTPLLLNERCHITSLLILFWRENQHWAIDVEPFTLNRNLFITPFFPPSDFIFGNKAWIQNVYLVREAGCR